MQRRLPQAETTAQQGMKDFVCQFETSTVVQASAGELFTFHSDPANLSVVMPPTLKVVKLLTDGLAEEGRLIELHCRDVWIIPMRWVCRWKTVTAPYLLVDEMLEGPFRVFEHEHRFEPLAEGGCRMTDRITYAWGRGWWGRLASEVGVRGYLVVLFAWRHYRTRRWAGRRRAG